jgi:hypothetical protein
MSQHCARVNMAKLHAGQLGAGLLRVDAAQVALQLEAGLLEGCIHLLLLGRLQGRLERVCSVAVGAL